MTYSPLTFVRLHLAPHGLYESRPPAVQRVPTTPVERPPLPASFSFSHMPTATAPLGHVVLGSSMSTRLCLTNTQHNREDVLGVRMMCEVQSPSERYRLGEAVHGKAERDKSASLQDLDELGRLAFDNSVELAVEKEMKELGLHTLIVSIAWETSQGRRTFQRFLRYNVGCPVHRRQNAHARSV